jgi:hypothetical protein
MSSAYLDPQPFRDWFVEQKEHHETEEIARWFGVDSRTLRRWDEESDRIRRGEFEDALMRSHFSLWDIYPPLAEATGTDEQTHAWCQGCREEVPMGEGARCLWCDGRVWRRRYSGAERSGPRPRLSDDQVRKLHQLHSSGITLAELGRRLAGISGHPNAIATEQAIRRGFSRLELPTRGNVTTDHRRCQGTKPNGARCSKHPLLNSSYCFQHDLEHREQVLRNAESARQGWRNWKAAAA